MRTLWHELVTKAGMRLSPEQEIRLARYLEHLLEANARMNLTGITDMAAAEIQHVADALTLLAFLPRGPHRLADVGSGGGVPGIVLAIVRGDATVALIESTQKKANFLKHASDRLGLKNVLILPERAEEAGRTNLRETFDVVTARAVAPLNQLLEWCLPLTKRGGKVLAMKGPKVEEELAAAQKASRLMAGGAVNVHAVTLPGISGHVIVEVMKEGKTDAKYPRVR
jgi:16S rRNA (guanine527-N7)-methyltransferase